MTTYEGRRYPTICPYLGYSDAGAAVDWLVEVFGFTERMRETRPDGSVGHCEIALGDGVVMLGTPPSYRKPDHNGPAHSVYVHVEDVDAHFAGAKDKGARVQGPPADQPYGVRSYGALDHEGNQWWFAQPLPD